MQESSSLPAVVVTGASTGIGEATVLELDRRGYQVFAGVRRTEDGRVLLEKSNGRLIPLLLDVTDSSQIAAAMQQVREATGERGLAGLVNNAGVAISSPLEIVPLSEFRRQLEINVVGQLAVIQSFLPLLRIGRGRIVNISSLNGALATPYLGPYSASKFAFEAVSDALRVELRHWGIKVVVIAPGAIKTPIWEKSLATADRMAQGVSPEGMKLYQSDLDTVRKTIVEIAEKADPVEKVVEKVVLALTAPRPRARYYLHFCQRFACRGLKILPEWMRDWIVRLELGLKANSF